MFQFTTTNVINSNKDFTTGKPLWSAQEAKDNLPASFNVKRVNKFLAPNVMQIFKAEGHHAEFAKATFDLSQVNGQPGDMFRLHIYIGLTQGSASSLYSNDLQWKGKPFSIDFVWLESAAMTVHKLVKDINRYSAMVYNKKLLNVSHSGPYLTIEATDEYQRFKFVNIEKFDADAYHGMGEYSVVRSLRNLKHAHSNGEVTPNAEGYFKGKEGFGTYSYILHNLRLPTYARTRWTALNQDETPIMGALYNQYTIHYCVNRGVLGDNAVGDLVKSKTTHVFYVRKDIADDFEHALSVLGAITNVAPKTALDYIEAKEEIEASISAALAYIVTWNGPKVIKDLNNALQNNNVNGMTVINKSIDATTAEFAVNFLNYDFTDKSTATVTGTMVIQFIADNTQSDSSFTGNKYNITKANVNVKGGTKDINVNMLNVAGKLVDQFCATIDEEKITITSCGTGTPTRLGVPDSGSVTIDGYPINVSELFE